MTAKEIQRLRYKFIGISMGSILLVMLFIGIVINTVVLTVTRRAIRSTLDQITERDGEIEEMTQKEEGRMDFPSFAEAFSPDFKKNHFFVIKYTSKGIFSGIVSNTQISSEIVDAKTSRLHVYDPNCPGRVRYFVIDREKTGVFKSFPNGFFIGISIS